MTCTAENLHRHTFRWLHFGKAIHVPNRHQWPHSAFLIERRRAKTAYQAYQRQWICTPWCAPFLTGLKLLNSIFDESGICSNIDYWWRFCHLRLSFNIRSTFVRHKNVIGLVQNVEKVNCAFWHRSYCRCIGRAPLPRPQSAQFVQQFTFKENTSMMHYWHNRGPIQNDVNPILQRATLTFVYRARHFDTDLR